MSHNVSWKLRCYRAEQFMLLGCHNLATVVDTDCPSGMSTWDINKGQDAVVPQEAIVCALGIEVDAHDLTVIVDVEGRDSGGVRDIDGEDGSMIPSIAMLNALHIDVSAHDLPLTVDAEGLVVRRGWDSDRNESPVLS